MYYMFKYVVSDSGYNEKHVSVVVTLSAKSSLLHGIVTFHN